MSFGNSIAIIDDGIRTKSIEQEKINYSIEITADLEIREIYIDDDAELSHGTSCANIIYSKFSDCGFVSIKILNENGQARSLQLVKALEWCILNKTRIINMSLGTVNFKDYAPVRKIINKAYRSGIIIIAASDNNGMFTLPASLENVIGVKCDKSNFLDGDDFIFHHTAVDGVNITTSPHHEIVRNGVLDYKFNESNSFGAPKITALVYGITSENPGISFFEIKQELWKRSKKQIPKIDFSYTRRIDWVDSCILIEIGADSAADKIEFSDIVTKKDTLKACTFSNELLLSISKIIADSNDKAEVIAVLIQPDFEMTVGEEKKMLAEILTYNKDFIYINDRSKLKCFPENETLNRYWHPFHHDDSNGSTDFQNESPVVLINDFTNFGYIDKIFGLVNSFKNEGYNAVVFSEASLGILFGFEYLSPYSYKGNSIEFTEYIRNCIRIFDPDLVLILAKGNSPIIDYINILQDDIQPDITFNLVHGTDNTIMPSPSNADIVATILASVLEGADSKGLLSTDDVEGIFKFIVSNMEKKESYFHLF